MADIESCSNTTLVVLASHHGVARLELNLFSYILVPSSCSVRSSVCKKGKVNPKSLKLLLEAFDSFRWVLNSFLHYVTDQGQGHDTQEGMATGLQIELRSPTRCLAHAAHTKTNKQSLNLITDIKPSTIISFVYLYNLPNVASDVVCSF